jgi:hypothetical protein
MRTPATWLILLHILAALWLAAGAFAGAVVRAHVKRATELRDKVNGLRIAWRLTSVYSVPGGILVGLVGLDLVRRTGHRWSELWVQLSTVLWVYALAVSLFYLRPRLKRTLRAAERALGEGRPSAELAELAAAKLPGILGDVNLVVIVVLTALMVLRPT